MSTLQDALLNSGAVSVESVVEKMEAKVDMYHNQGCIEHTKIQDATDRLNRVRIRQHTWDKVSSTMEEEQAIQSFIQRCQKRLDIADHKEDNAYDELAKYLKRYNITL